MLIENKIYVHLKDDENELGMIVSETILQRLSASAQIKDVKVVQELIAKNPQLEELLETILVPAVVETVPLIGVLWLNNRTPSPSYHSPEELSWLTDDEAADYEIETDDDGEESEEGEEGLDDGEEGQE